VTGSLLLSVVVVCRNQRDLVVGCIRSVLRETASLAAPYELLVIDSASTDGSREALEGLPVRWAGLAESPLLCASLGRRTGTELANGRYLLFLDGDMELEPGFLSAALDLLEREETVAGVVGQVFEKDPAAASGRRDIYRIRRAGTAERFGGAVLFSRRSLLRAGGYDPYIFNREENELYSRIRAVGETVRQIPVPMAVHHDPPASLAEKVLRELLPGRKRGLGRTQAFLRAFRKGNLLSYVRQERLFFLSMAVDAASLAALALVPTPAGWRALALLQAGSFVLHGLSWSFGQYLLNKLALVQFLAGLVVVPALLRRPLPAVAEKPR